jgi:DNA replication protein DnaC
LSRTTNKLVFKTHKTESLYGLSLSHEQTDTLLQNHPFVLEHSKKQEDHPAIGQLQDEPKIQGHELVLLPKRLFAYALQDRKFVMLDIANAKSIAQTGDPFKELIISRSHKDMISSLVHAHFEKKQMEQLHGFYHTSQDIIHNKGRGLVILLHGVPGVGKSSTAEAVAQRWKRPLLAITCGDLGLEEADVFLSQRSVSDLQRNSLVSGKLYRHCKFSCLC